MPNGRLIALGIHPVAPTGPVAVPAGNRRGTFAATPQGKAGRCRERRIVAEESKSGATNAGLTRFSACWPACGRVRTPARHARNGAASRIRELRQVLIRARALPLRLPTIKSPTWTARFSAVSAFYGDDAQHAESEFLDRQLGDPVCGTRRRDGKTGELLAPVATEKSDPGYPLELMRANVHGTVTLYAVIHSDGKVGDIRVLNSPDERLDAFAAKRPGPLEIRARGTSGKTSGVRSGGGDSVRVRRSF